MGAATLQEQISLFNDWTWTLPNAHQVPCRVSFSPDPASLYTGTLTYIVARALSDVTQLIQRFENILSHAQVRKVLFVFPLQTHRVYLLCSQTQWSDTRMEHLG